MSRFADMIYLSEEQWRGLVDLLPEINRQMGLFGNGIGGGRPVILYQRDKRGAGPLTIASESSFVGEFEIAEDGSITYPAEWDD